MPRSFARPPRPAQHQVKDKEVFEAEFSPADRGGVKSSLRVNGRIAFPERHGKQPQDGDIWKVEIAGENPSGSVYFLRCLERVSTEAERRAASHAERNRINDLWQQRQTLKPDIQSWLDSFNQWTEKETRFEVKGVACVLHPKIEKFASQTAGLVLSVIPVVEYLEGTVNFSVVQITIPWNELQVKRVYVRETWKQVCADVTTVYGDHDPVFFATYAGEVRFISWERDANKLQAKFALTLNGISGEAKILVAAFLVEKGKGEIGLYVRDVNREQKEQIEHYVPQIPSEHMKWIEELKAEHETYGERMRTAGLLAIVGNSSVYTKLKELFVELGYGGIGWSPWGKDRNPYVIHPALRPLVEGLPNVELIPAKMQSGAPEQAWQAITWTNCFEPPAQAEIARLSSETVEEEEAVDPQEWLQPFGAGKTPLPCIIVCEELAVPHENEKYVFHAKVEAPYIVRSRRKHTFDTYGIYSKPPVIRERTVQKPDGYTFKNIAYGNEKFEGIAELTVDFVKRIGWKVFWKAPEIKTEETFRKVTAIRELIRRAREDQIAMSGWRYTDTGNPVILVNYDNEGWVIREFNRDTYTVEKRKGGGSNRAIAYSLRLNEIQKAMNIYLDFNWPVVQDPNWQEVAGTSILSLFPEDLVKKLGGE